MRKQLRILLFAALVAILVVMTALVISADYTVTDKEGAPVGENEGVYATLAEAVAAVTDGGTITVNGDVTEAATDLSKAGVSYAIKGGSTEGMNTLTLTGGLSLTNGSVTIENLAIVANTTEIGAAGITLGGGTLTLNGASVACTGANSAILMNGAATLEVVGGSVTAENVDTPKGGAIYMNGTDATTTIKGDASVVGGNGVYLNAKGTLNIEGGIVKGTQGSGVVAVSGGVVVNVSGGTVSSEGTANGVVTGTDPESGANLHAFGGHAVWFRNGASFTMTGGTLTNSGENCAVLLVGHGHVTNGASLAPAITISGGTITSTGVHAHGILVYMGKPTVTISGTAKIELKATVKVDDGKGGLKDQDVNAGNAIRLSSAGAILVIEGGTLISRTYYADGTGDAYLDTYTGDDINGTICISAANTVTINGGRIEAALKHGITICGTLSAMTVNGTKTGEDWSTVITAPSRGIYMRPTAALADGGKGITLNGGYFYGDGMGLDFRSNVPVSMTGGDVRCSNANYKYALYIKADNGCNISITGGTIVSFGYHTIVLAGKIDYFHIGGNAYIENTSDTTNRRTIQITASILTKTEGEGDNAVTTVIGKGIEITGGTIVNKDFRSVSIEAGDNIFKMSGGTILTKDANFGFYAQGPNQVIEITGGTISAAYEAIYLINSSSDTTRFAGTVTISGGAVIQSTLAETAISVNGDVDLTINGATITSVVGAEPAASAGAIYVGATVNGITIDIKGTYDEEKSDWSTKIVGSQGIYINTGCTLTIDGALVGGTAGAGLVVYGASTVTLKNGVICSTATEGDGVVNGTATEGGAQHAFGAHAVWLRSASTFNMEGGMLMNVAAVPTLLIRHGNTTNNAGNGVAHTVNISGGQIYATAGAAISANMGVITLNISGGTIMSTAASTVLVGNDGVTMNLTGGVLGCYAEQAEGSEYAPALVDFGGFAGSFTVNGGILVPYVTGLVVINAKEAVGDEAGTVVTAGDNFAIVSTSGVAFAGQIFGYDDSVTVMMGEDECMGWAQYKGSTELILNLADGATARVVRGEEDETGIRFSTTIDAENAAIILGMKESGLTVTYGTLIAPAEYVVVAGGFTHAAMEAFEAEYEYDVAYVDVVANVSLVESAAGISFNAALVNIKEENTFREFVAVSYVCIDGTYYYSDFSTASNTSMMVYVAMDALSDVSSTKAGVYAYPSVVEQGKFSRYTEECQNYLLAFVPAA